MKCAIVTGAANGIGLALARMLARTGYGVALADVDTKAGRPLEDEIEGSLFIETDVSDEGSVRAMVDEAASLLGMPEVLINNAGMGINKPIDTLSLHEWNKVVGTNLTGPFLCAKYAAPYLRKSRGSIINIASTRAIMSEPDTEAYSASKGGLVALTHALAMSLGPEVRVNCISPGWIETRGETPTPEDHAQHPAGRVGRVDDIAALVAFLISDKSGFITGQNHVIDGGMTRKMIYL